MSHVPLNRAHHALRQGTAAAHHVLDHHPLLQRLARSGLTRAQYAQSLAAMHAPHVQLERLVHDSHHCLSSGLSLTTRQALLEADLVDLGRTVVAVTPASPSLVARRAAWWGRVYVLEGSRQGASVIARCIHSSLGDSVPCRFLAEPLANDSRSALLAMLEDALEDDADLKLAIASACAAFADYQAGLDACTDATRDVVGAGLLFAGTSSGKAGHG